MKRVLLSLLVVILILGALGAAGFAGYQLGFQRAAFANPSGNAPSLPRNMGPGPRGMLPHDFGLRHGFDRGFDRGFGMMGRGMGFGFFGPLMFLARIAFWALVIWAIYMLVTRSGWRLTRAAPANVNPQAPAETYTRVERTESETTSSGTEPENKE